MHVESSVDLRVGGYLQRQEQIEQPNLEPAMSVEEVSDLSLRPASSSVARLRSSGVRARA